MIALEDRQWRLVREAPFPFLRGCLRSDGCGFVNRTTVHRPAPYECVSCQFSNMSGDIVDVFVAVCRQTGIYTRLNRASNGLWTVGINRRQSVARLLEHVGRKR